MPPAFWISFPLLSLARLSRGVTPLVFSLSAMLTLEACWRTLIAGPDDRDLALWLSAAAWVCTLWGAKDREPVLPMMPLLLFYLFHPAGFIGLLTGLALNLPVPRRKPRPEPETYGITRVPLH